jgi:S-adenosylmethionine/arginine decarboxylase-like enzyme
MLSWGKHSIHNIFRASPYSIRCRQTITAFNKELVKAIDMIPYGEPQVVRFGEGNKYGYTSVQLIQTSNIIAHFVEETNDFYLDVFSCKDFDPKIVEQVITKYFRPTNIDTHVFERIAKPKERIPDME